MKTVDPTDQIEAIKSFVARAVRETEGRLAGKPKNGRPLYVVLGEDHKAFSHIAAEILFIQTLKEKGYKISVGLEQPSNLLSSIFHRWADQQLELPVHVIDALAARLTEGNKGNNSLHLQAMAGQPLGRDAPLSNQCRARFLLEAKIQTAMNDAAESVTHGRFIMTDSGVSQVLNEFKVNKKEVTYEENLGVAIRNRIIVDHAIERSEDIDLHIEIGGAGHGVGHDPAFLYRRSLTAVFADRGEDVFCIPMQSGDKSHRIPSEAYASGLVMEDTVLPALKGAKEDSWLREIMPAILPGLNLHENLEGFQRDCSQATKKEFIAVLPTEEELHAFSPA
jgi:hypothetical protein